MKRKLTILSVLVAVYLVVSVAPVSAAHVAMVSSHTTASELSNGSLDNAEVERAGAAGFVGHDTYSPDATARYALDHGSGTTAYDYVGGLDGQISGATWEQGVSGSSLNLSEGGEVDLPNNILSVSGGFSYSIWLNPDNQNAGYIIENRGDTETILQVSDGNLEVYTGSWEVVAPVSTDSWQHAAVTYDGSTLRVYLDGKLEYSASKSLSANSMSNYLGRLGSGGSYDGKLDDARFYDNAVLTPGEVSRLSSFPNTKQSPSATERWAFDAGQGSTIYGDSGLDSTDGSFGWASGVSGTALSVNGSGEYATVPDDSSIDFTNQITMSAWVNPDTEQLQTVIDKRDPGTRRGYELNLRSNNEVAAEFFDTNGDYHNIYSGEKLGSGWHHVAVTHDGSELRVYIDGELVNSKSASFTIGTTSKNLHIGARKDGRYFDGKIDEVRLYGQDLSGSKIQQLHNRPAASILENSSYTSADHQATNSVKGYTDLELRNATATVTWRTADGTVLNETTFSSSGNHTLTWTSSSADNVDVDVEFDPTHPDHTARLHGEGVYAETNAPSVDDSSLSPNSTSSTVGSLPVTLSASVSDPDFGTIQGDSATVEWYVDGSKRAEQTVSSNGTVSYDLDNIDAGTHDWHVEISDDDGHTDTSATASFAMPGELKIYNESAPNSLVDSATVNIQFYGGQDGDAFTVQRSTTDGTIDMTGLPADQEFIVVVNSDGYHNRRIYLESLTEQGNVYLLPTSEKAVYNVFRIDDKSGSYPPGETRIIIQRALNRSGNFTWQTVSGDFFGSTNEHKTNLRYNVRYRLIVENDQGQRRMMGPYFATDENNPKVITVSSIVVSPPEGQAYYGTSWIDDETEDGGQKTLRFAYTDPDEATDSLDVVIYERGNESNVLAEISTDNVGDKWTYSTVLDENESAKSWVVEWKGQRNGEEIGAAVPVGNRGGLPIPMDGEWLTRFGMIALVVVASLSSERMATIGAMGTVAFAGILMITGIWEIPVVLWFAALIIAVGGHALTKAQRGGVVG